MSKKKVSPTRTGVKDVSAPNISKPSLDPLDAGTSVKPESEDLSWLLIGPEVESKARAIVTGRQRTWDGYSEQTRALYESWEHRRPEDELIDLTARVALRVVGALYKGDKDALERMLAAVNVRQTIGSARRAVVQTFERALRFTRNGIGKWCSSCGQVCTLKNSCCEKCGHDERRSAAVLFLAGQLSEYESAFQRLTLGELVVLLRTGQVSGRRLRSDAGVVSLAAAASIHCNAFGDAVRPLDTGKYEKWLRKHPGGGPKEYRINLAREAFRDA